MPERLKTETDLSDLPDDSYRHELVAGVIVAEPLPMHRHDRTRRHLERLLEDFVEPRGLGEVFGEAGYVLARAPDTVRWPDLSFVSADRLRDFDDARFAGSLTTSRALLTPIRVEAAAILDGGDVLPGLAIPVDEIFEG